MVACGRPLKQICDLFMRINHIPYTYVHTNSNSAPCFSSLWALMMIGFLVYLVLACFSVIDGFGQKVTSTKVKVKVTDKLKVRAAIAAGYI